MFIETRGVLINEFTKEVEVGKIEISVPDPLSINQDIFINLTGFSLTEDSLHLIEAKIKEIVTTTELDEIKSNTSEFYILIDRKGVVEGVYFHNIENEYGRSLLPLEVAEAIIDMCIDTLEIYYAVCPTGYVNLDEDEEIIGKEIIITLTNSESTVEVATGGWLEVDRRDLLIEVGDEDEIIARFSGIFIINFDNTEIKFGGGINEDYRTIMFDFYVNKDGKITFNKPYIDTI